MSSDSIDISTYLGKECYLKSCLMNASGAYCTTHSELYDLEKSKSGAMITKSMSFFHKDGNPKPRYYHDSDLSINSMGLANMGHVFYLANAKSVKTKPYIVSIAALDINQTISIIQDSIENPNVAAIEFNISCPNICQKDTILAYHYDDLDNYLKIIEPYITKANKPFGLKLPPYWEAAQFKNIVQLIIKYKFNFITLINSVPNCLVIDTESESPVIKPKNGVGGLGGKFIKPIVLSNIYQFRQLLPTDIQIIGCGGVETGEDVFHHLLAGASIVQIGTSLMREGPQVFDRIEKELLDIMRQKQYTNLNQIIGKIKYNTPSHYDY
jgi:dihydroorotate dehydrogenase (fumarate)